MLDRQNVWARDLHILKSGSEYSAYLAYLRSTDTV